MKLAAALVLVAATAAADRLPDPKPHPPIAARILQIQVAGGGIVVTAGAGADAGVLKTDACVFLDGKDKPLPNDCVVIRVDKRTTFLKTTMTVDQIKASPRVQLTGR